CRAMELRCDASDFGDRLALWKDAGRAASVTAPEEAWQGLAARFNLTPGHVRASLATARDLATMKGLQDVDVEDIGAAARLTSDHGLGRLATKVDRKHGWDDLVLPATTLRTLRELTAAVRHRHVVYSEWGFGERIITGVGIKALFAGASGTGK